MDYHLDAEVLNAKFHDTDIPLRTQEPQTFLLTGVTGFLGSHILAELLSRSPRVTVYAHVRARSVADARSRIEETCDAYGLWHKWLNEKRLQFVIGDLSKPRLGLEQGIWSTLVEKVDVIIHNGAR